MNNKELCDCGKVATWDYTAGYSGGGNSYSCDDCVPRGCTCNHRYVNVNSYHPPLEHPDLPEGKEGEDWKWLDDEKTHWCHIDGQGREYPCVEYSYDEEGWDLD